MGPILSETVRKAGAGKPRGGPPEPPMARAPGVDHVSPLRRMRELSEYAKQLGAFLILVVVQSTAILLFKLCQEGGK